jgi:hypothetical protein
MKKYYLETAKMNALQKSTDFFMSPLQEPQIKCSSPSQKADLGVTR